MNARHVIDAWGLILRGYRPNLSIEITRECPLRCPGCYAYGDQHLGGDVVLRQLSDYKGQALIDRTLQLVKDQRPLHVSIVGGEPLVRFRELDVILPKLSALGIHTQVVTSAVRPIPEAWASIPHLQICVSVDGLQPEHDVRRTPATYDRILKHIKGQQVTIHCTVTRQQTRPGYLAEFSKFWAALPDVRRIWFSLYTPQQGEQSEERLTDEDRRRVVAEIAALAAHEPKLSDMRANVLRGLLAPPTTPDECIFAKTTTCVSADLEKAITPCQFGGDPVCTECGCLASAGFVAVGEQRLAGVLSLKTVFDASFAVGAAVRRTRPSSDRPSGIPAGHVNDPQSV